MSYGDKARALAAQAGTTPATVQQYLDRLQATGLDEAEAIAKFTETSFADLDTLLDKAEKK
jgi:hypothetical protein